VEINWPRPINAMNKALHVLAHLGGPVSDPGRGCQLPAGRQAAAGSEEHHATRSLAAGPARTGHEYLRVGTPSRAQALNPGAAYGAAGT
jgi:hypothetical protein